MKVPMIAIGVLLVFVIGIVCEVQVWNECRETNSFMYCMRVLSK